MGKKSLNATEPLHVTSASESVLFPQERNCCTNVIWQKFRQVNIKMEQIKLKVITQSTPIEIFKINIS